MLASTDLQATSGCPVPHLGDKDTVRRESVRTLRNLNLNLNVQNKDGRSKDRAPDTAERTERQLVNGMSLGLPCLTESDMRDVDTEPGEDGTEAR